MRLSVSGDLVTEKESDRGVEWVQYEYLMRWLTLFYECWVRNDG